MQEPLILDMEQDPRREHFHYFRQMANPYVGVTCEVELTAFDARRREAGMPFFLSFLWCAAKAANSVPELRRRLRGESVLEYACCPTSHTVERPDGTYGYCRLEGGMPLAAFLPYARREQEAVRIGTGLAEEAADALPLFFVSTLPWLNYTALAQPTPVPADSNPRLTWGRYQKRGGQLWMPVSLLCHHALADGRHLAEFYAALEQTLAGEL